LKERIKKSQTFSLCVLCALCAKEFQRRKEKSIQRKYLNLKGLRLVSLPGFRECFLAFFGVFCRACQKIDNTQKA